MAALRERQFQTRRVNIARLVLITSFVLSAFIAANSFIAIDKVEQWSDDLRRFFMTEQSEVGKRVYPIEYYLLESG
jgi:hypothetical protein